jgi:hypothetical protein
VITAVFGNLAPGLQLPEELNFKLLFPITNFLTGLEEDQIRKRKDVGIQS